jgi:hypothetical protein
MPWFTIYISHQIISTVILYRLYGLRDPVTYFFVAWGFEGLTITLGFMVILDTFRTSFAQYESIRRLGTRLFILAAVLSVVVALILLPYGTNTSATMMKFLWLSERSLRIIQLSLLVTMFALSSYLALSWRHHIFGIALGYGLYASVNLACYAALAYLGMKAGPKMSLLDSGAYCCAVAIWLTYLLQREPKGPGLPATVSQDLSEWSEALSDLKKTAR